MHYNEQSFKLFKSFFIFRIARKFYIYNSCSYQLFHSTKVLILLFNSFTSMNFKVLTNRKTM